jgi:soluble cytochrome b562
LIFKALTDDEQRVITTAINQINTFAQAGKYEEVKKVLDQLEKVLKMWKK